MMLLLNGHIAEAVASGLRQDGTDALGLHEWREGQYRTASDDEILRAAAEDNRVLVTHDMGIQDLLRQWAQAGQHHSGVIFINSRTISQTEIGQLLRALRIVVREQGDIEWRDGSAFLRRPPEE